MTKNRGLYWLFEQCSKPISGSDWLNVLAARDLGRWERWDRLQFALWSTSDPHNAFQSEQCSWHHISVTIGCSIILSKIKGSLDLHPEHHYVQTKIYFMFLDSVVLTKRSRHLQYQDLQVPQRGQCLIHTCNAEIKCRVVRPRYKCKARFETLPVHN